MRKIILILILILATSCSLESNLPERTIQERNSLPEITEIEVWEEEYLILRKRFKSLCQFSFENFMSSV